MNDNILKEDYLSNGLKFKIINKSKQIASNTFYLCIILTVIVPVQEKWFKKIDLGVIKFKKILEKLESEITFEQTYEKHFVEKSTKNKLISSILSNILESSIINYLSNDKFPGKLILNRFIRKN